ncbi:hypothetical protein HYH02_000204 [Chlamydomonas schloesseri]|uniref:Uncharacterized protein n=1 Tax=Chlamydomonas schloesseri TaxID=2026947 RepID=A0A835WMA2_9CHLO|nr:hypothetical protein HYH02_000204 [Chlamydomonas schloesseri]|eukprot:KAG2450100.1 hypothetical protein HYH02_000204 [Chlamydomonas schloesseri]
MSAITTEHDTAAAAAAPLAPALPPVAADPAASAAPAPAAPEAAAAAAAAPETAVPAKKHKATASGPSGGYISEKLAVFARAVRKLWKDAKETGKRYKAEPVSGGKKAAAGPPVSGAAPTTAAEGAAAAPLGAAPAPATASATPPGQSPPSSASPHTSAGGAAGGGAGANPITGAVQRVVEAAHTHEPADQLQTRLSPAHKLANAVVSTIEHVADEAAAVQAGLTAGVREELDKLTHDSHEAQQPHAAHTATPPITSPAAASALGQPLAGTANSAATGAQM